MSLLSNLRKYSPSIPPVSHLVIWTPVLLVLSGLTLLDFIPLLRDYKEKNVATQIRVTKSKAVQPYNITACLPYYMGSIEKISKWLANTSGNDSCEEYMALADHGWTVWNGSNWTGLDDDIRDNMVATSLLHELITHQNWLDILAGNKSNFNWNQPIVEAVWMFFSCIYQQDVWFNTKEMWKPNHCTGLNSSAFDALSALEHDQLYDSLIESVSAYLKVNASGEHGEFVGLPDLKYRHPVTILDDKFCFSLLHNSTTEDFIMQPFDDQSDPPWKRYKRTGDFEVYPNPEIHYSVTRSFESLYQTDKLKRTTVNSEKVTLTYNVETRVVESRTNTGCSKDKNAYVCLAKMQAVAAMELCQCIPFTFRHFQSDQEIDHEYLIEAIDEIRSQKSDQTKSNSFSDHNMNHMNLPYCSPRHYQKCAKDLSAISVMNLDKCHDKCEYIFYQWTPNSVSKHEETTRFDFKININNEPAPYMEFTVAVKDSPEKFVAQIGGIVNLYLGLSGLSLCSIIIFCMETYKSWKQSKKCNQEKQNAMVEGQFSQMKTPKIRLNGDLKETFELLQKEMLERNEAAMKKEFGKMRDEMKKIVEEMKYSKYSPIRL